MPSPYRTSQKIPISHKFSESPWILVRIKPPAANTVQGKILNECKRDQNFSHFQNCQILNFFENPHIFFLLKMVTIFIDFKKRPNESFHFYMLNILGAEVLGVCVNLCM